MHLYRFNDISKCSMLKGSYPCFHNKYFLLSTVMNYEFDKKNPFYDDYKINENYQWCREYLSVLHNTKWKGEILCIPSFDKSKTP